MATVPILGYETGDRRADAEEILRSLLNDADDPDMFLGPEPFPSILFTESTEKELVRGSYLESKPTAHSSERGSSKAARTVINDSLERDVPPATAKQVGAAVIKSESVPEENEIFRLQDDPSVGAWHRLPENPE